MALRKTTDIKETISNVSVTLIQITEERLVNILNAHIAKIKKGNDWATALALFISLFGIAVSTDFHDTLGIKADMLKGAFYLIILISFLYFLYVAYNCYKNKDSVEDIISDIKTER